MHRFVDSGYGMPAITWEVGGAHEPGAYAVNVTGIRGAAASTRSPDRGITRFG